MKNIILVWIISICCYHCKAQSTVPESVNVEKTDALQRIKGTKFFVAMPENYKPVANQMRIDRDMHTYLQVIEIPGISYTECKDTISKIFIENNIAKLDIQPLKYNHYDAVYFSGPSKNTDEAMLGVIFGDENFTAIVVCVYLVNDKNARSELNNLLYTSYYDQSFELDFMERAHFTFDLEISGFKLASHTENNFVYTVNGVVDELEADYISSFKFYSLKAADFIEAKEQFDYILKFHNWNMKMLRKEEKNIMINGNDAYTLLIEAKEGNQLYTTLYVLIQKGDRSVIYIATDYDNKKWLDKFSRTAASIKLK